MVLHAASVYFKTMFASGWKERGQSEVWIKDVDGDILQHLVAYCYSGEIAIDSENVDEMTKAAMMLQFTEVEEHCTEFYGSILNASNCLGIRETADIHNVVKLKEMVQDFVLYNFVEVSKCEEFGQLSINEISALLKDEALNVVAEEEVFGALVGWIKFDINGRKQLVESLLECIRFQLIKEFVSKPTTSLNDLFNYRFCFSI